MNTIWKIIGIGALLAVCVLAGCKGETPDSVEYNINSAVININPGADFSGFPATLTLTAATTELTLTGSGLSGAEWYINGELKQADGKSFTLNKSEFINGQSFSLTVVVKSDNGQFYSKQIMVAVL